MADKYVTKISGSPIAAVIAARDADGNQIDTTYVKHDSDGNVTISGNLTVNGSTTTVSTENLAIKDPMLRLATGNTAALSTLIGFRATKIDGSNDALLAVSSSGDVYAGLFANSTLDSGITTSTSGLYKLAKNSDVTTLQGYFTNEIANNADKLDGYHVTSSGNYWNVVPFVRSGDGVMEIGQYIDFHTDSAGSRDYDGRIQGQKNGGNLLIPTKSGTIATDDVATQSANGLMSSTDKKKLDGIGRGTTVFEVTRGASHTTAKTGYWAAMLNTVSDGAPVLPTSSGWWHVISMDWSGTDLTNWISQIAFPTQDQASNAAADSPYYRHNTASTSIDKATWHKFITDQNIGSQSVSYATSAGSATTSSYPAGFSSSSAGFSWGNSTGTSIASWNTSTSGAVGWKNDNPSSGKVSMLIDGRVYVDEGSYPVMGMNYANGYWGIGDPDGASTSWIRTTSQGIIPYSSEGSGSLGTESWPFSTAYINTVYESGTALSSKYVTLATEQTITAAKTFSDGVTVSKSSGFLYSGIESAASNAERPVWFSYQDVIGKPVYNNNFKYNPSTATLTLNSGNGGLNGRVITSYASGTWINSASNATVTCNYTTYGGIFSAATKNGRVSLATYPDSSAGTDCVYLNYFTTSQITAGTNSVNNQIYWDAASNKLYTSAIDVRNSSITSLAVGGGLYWNPYVESATDSSDACSITLLSSGANGGTELRIKVMNDASDIINLVTPQFIYMNSKCALDVSDSWLRLNASSGFSSGIYTGSSLIRTDAALQVGDSGKYLLANSNGTTTTTLNATDGYATNYFYNKRGGSTGYQCLDTSSDSYASIMSKITAANDPIVMTADSTSGTLKIGLDDDVITATSVSQSAITLYYGYSTNNSFKVPSSIKVDKYGRTTELSSATVSTGKKIALTSGTVVSPSLTSPNSSSSGCYITGAGRSATTNTHYISCAANIPDLLSSGSYLSTAQNFRNIFDLYYDYSNKSSNILLSRYTDFSYTTTSSSTSGTAATTYSLTNYTTVADTLDISPKEVRCVKHTANSGATSASAAYTTKTASIDWYTLITTGKLAYNGGSAGACSFYVNSSMAYFGCMNYVLCLAYGSFTNNSGGGSRTITLNKAFCGTAANGTTYIPAISNTRLFMYDGNGMSSNGPYMNSHHFTSFSTNSDGQISAFTCYCGNNETGTINWIMIGYA